MKKKIGFKSIILFLICITMIFAFTACGEQKTNVDHTEKVVNDTEGVELSSEEALKTIWSAVNEFQKKENSNYINTSFDVDAEVELKGKLEKYNFSYKSSINRRNNKNSRLSFVISKFINGERKTLVGFYYQKVNNEDENPVLMVDARGMSDGLTILQIDDVDITAFANLVSKVVDNPTISQAIKQNKDNVPLIINVLTKFFKDDIKAFVKSSQDGADYSVHFNLNPIIEKVSNLIKSGDIITFIKQIDKNIDTSKIEEQLPKITEVLDKIEPFLTSDFQLVLNSKIQNGMMKGIGFDLNAYNVPVVEDCKVSINVPHIDVKNPPICDKIADYNKDSVKPYGLANLYVNTEVALDITSGKISLLGVDGMLGNKLTALLQKTLKNSEFNLGNTDLNFDNDKIILQLEANFNISLTNNDKTNIEINIKKDGKLLAGIYYKGENQTFYVNLEGLSAGKFKIEEVNGERINLTEFIKVKLNEGYNKFIETLKSKNNANAVETDEVQELLNSGQVVRNVAVAKDGTPSLDIMSLVKDLLKGFKVEKDEYNDKLLGFTLKVGEDVISTLLEHFGISLPLEDVELQVLKGADVENTGTEIGLNITLNPNRKNIKSEVKTKTVKELPKPENNEKVEETEQSNAYPIFSLSANITLDYGNKHPMNFGDVPLYEYNKMDLPIKIVNEDGKNKVKLDLDSVGTVYARAEAKFSVNVNEGTIDMGEFISNALAKYLKDMLIDFEGRLGNVSANYNMVLEANANIPAFIAKKNKDLNVKDALSKQQIKITIEKILSEDGEEKVDVLTFYFDGKDLYIDGANYFGIPRTVIPIIDLIPEDLFDKNENADANGIKDKLKPDDLNLDAGLILGALIKNVDIVSFAKQEIAIILNNEILNNVLEVIMPEKEAEKYDLTLSGLSFNIKDNAKADKGLLENLELGILAKSEYGDGLKIKLDLTLHNFLVDLTESKLEFFNENLSKKDFKNPVDEPIINVQTSGTLKLEAEDNTIDFDGVIIDGEFGALLSTLLFDVNIEQFKAGLKVDISAKLDLRNDEVAKYNTSQIIIEIRNPYNENELYAGLYYANGWMYVNAPFGIQEKDENGNIIKNTLNIDPFKIEFDIANLLKDLVKKTGKPDAISNLYNSVNANGLNGNALGTNNVEKAKAAFDAGMSFIQLSQTDIKINLCETLVKNILISILGDKDFAKTAKSMPVGINVVGKIDFENVKKLGIDVNAYITDSNSVSKCRLNMGLGGFRIDYMAPRDLIYLKNQDGGIKSSISYKSNILFVGELPATSYANFGKVDLRGAMDDAGKINKDAVLSQLSGKSLSFKTTGRIGVIGTQGGVQYKLNEILGKLPSILVRLNVLDNIDNEISFKICANAYLGNILDGDYNNALELSLTLYNGKKVIENNKLAQIIVLGNDIYIDCCDNSIVDGKLKLENIDFSKLLDKDNEKAEGNSVESKDENESDNKGFAGIVNILNYVVQTINITPNEIGVNFSTQILSAVVDLLFTNSKTIDANDVDKTKLPLTAGNVKFVYNGEENGLFADIGIANPNNNQIELIGVTLGLTQISLGMKAKERKGFIYDNNFSEENYSSYDKLENLYVKTTIDLNAEFIKQKIDLNSLVGSLVGDIVFLFGIDIGTLNKYDLAINVEGNLGLKDAYDTEVALNIIDKNADLDKNTILQIYLRNNRLYVSSEQLNIPDFETNKIGLAKVIKKYTDKVFNKNATKTDSSALSTAEDGNVSIEDALISIGGKNLAIKIGKNVILALAETLLKEKVEDDKMNIVTELIDKLDLALSAGIDFENMSINANVDTSIVKLGIGLDDIKISTSKKEIFDKNVNAKLATYEHFNDHIMAEVCAEVSISKKEFEEQNLTSVLGYLCNLLPDDKANISSILSQLALMVSSTYDGALYFGVVVQANIDLTNLRNSNFGIRLSYINKNPKEDVKPEVTFVDIMAIGSKNSLFFNGNRFLNNTQGLLVRGVNVYDLINKNANAIATDEESNGNIAGLDLKKIMGILNGTLSGIELSNNGLSVGFSRMLMSTVAGLLLKDKAEGLVLPELSKDSGLCIDLPNTNSEKSESPTIDLKVAIDKIGALNININRYYVGFTEHSVKDGFKIKSLISGKINESEFNAVTDLRNTQLEVDGKFTYNLSKTGNDGKEEKDLSSLVNGLLSDVIPAIITKLNINDEYSGDFKFKVLANLNLDKDAIMKDLELGFEIYQDINIDNNIETKKIFAVYYTDGSLFIEAPTQVGNTIRIDNVDKLLNSIIEKKENANATSSEEILGANQTKAKLGLVLGDGNIQIVLAKEVIQILLALMDGENIDLSDFESQKVTLEAGTVQDGNPVLRDIYLKMIIDFAPIKLELKVDNTVFRLGETRSIVPDTITNATGEDAPKPIEETVLSVGAKGYININAKKAKINLNTLLNAFGVKNPIEFETALASDTDIGLYISLDADICLGNIKDSLKIAIKIHGEDEENDCIGKQIIAIYVVGDEIYIDLGTGMLSLPKVKIDFGVSKLVKNFIDQLLEQFGMQTDIVKTAVSTADDEKVEDKTRKEVAAAILIGIKKSNINVKLNEIFMDAIFQSIGLDSLMCLNMDGDVNINFEKPEISVNIGMDISEGNKAGIELRLNNFYAVTKRTDGMQDFIPSKTELKDEFVDVTKLDESTVHLGLKAGLETLIPSDFNAENDNNKTSNDKLTKWIGTFFPWIPDLLVQLNVIQKDQKADFFNKFELDLNVNLHLDCLFKQYYCSECGKYYRENDLDPATGECPNGHSSDCIHKRSFSVKDLDFSLAINYKNSQDKNVQSEKIFAVYLKDGVLKIFGQELGFGNYELDENAINSIIETVVSKTSKNKSTAISTTDDKDKPVDEKEESTDKKVNVLGLLNSGLRSVAITATGIRAVLSEYIFNLIPGLEEDAPAISENNYLEINIYDPVKDTLDLTAALNLNIVGLNLKATIVDFNLCLITPNNIKDTNIDVPVIEKLKSLDMKKSVLKVNFQADFDFKLPKVEETKLNELLGSVLGDLTSTYENKSDVLLNYKLQVEFKIDIKTLQLEAAIKLNNKETDKNVLAAYYDSKNESVYVESTVVPSFKITGINVIDLIKDMIEEKAKEKAEEKAEATANANEVNNENGENSEINEETTENIGLDNPYIGKKAIIVTVNAIKKYLAVQVTAEILQQIICSIGKKLDLPALPNIDIDVVFDKGSVEDVDNTTAMALNLIAKVRNYNKNYLAEICAKLYLSSEKVNGEFKQGTTLEFMTSEDAEKEENVLIPENVRNFPSLLDLQFDGNNKPKPNFLIENVNIGGSLTIDFGVKQGNLDWSAMVQNLFKNHKVPTEIKAILESAEDLEKVIALDINAKVNLNNLLNKPLILKGSVFKIAVRDVKEEKILLDILIDGDSEIIYIQLPSTKVKTEFGESETRSLRKIKIDTLQNGVLTNLIRDLLKQNEVKTKTALATTDEDSKKLDIGKLLNSALDKIIINDNKINIVLKQDILKTVIGMLKLPENSLVKDIVLPQIVQGVISLDLANITETGLNGVSLNINGAIEKKLIVGLGLNINHVNFDKDFINEQLIVQNEEEYISIGNLQTQLDLSGYMEFDAKKNSDSNPPLNLGGMIANLLKVKDVDFNFNVAEDAYEKYSVDIRTYIDTKDFGNTKMELTLYNEDHEHPEKKKKFSLYLDAGAYINDNGDKIGKVYADLNGLQLPKLSISGINIAGLLDGVVGKYLGHKTVDDSTKAFANADGNNNEFNSADFVGGLLKLAFAKDEFVCEINAQLLNMVINLVNQIKLEKNENAKISNLQFPDIDTGKIGINKDGQFYVSISETNMMSCDIFVSDYALKENYSEFLPNSEELDEFVNVFDLQNGLQAEYLSMDLKLSLDMAIKDNNSEKSFARYLSKLVCSIVEGNDTNYANYLITVDPSSNIKYELKVNGNINLKNIFKSEIALEFRKKADGLALEKELLIGLYLRCDDSTSDVPTLFVNLSGLGLPKVKLESIDKFLGGLLGDKLSALGIATSAISTANTLVDAQADGKVNAGNLTVWQNIISLGVDSSFIYKILAEKLPEKISMSDGVYSLRVKDKKIPLPNMGVLSSTFNFNQGLKEIKLGIELDKTGKNKLTGTLGIENIKLESQEIDWNKYDKAPHEFSGYGAIHIGTSFKPDMINSIVDSISPNITIQYNKRTDGKAGEYNNNIDSLTNYAAGGDNWEVVRYNQAWTNIKILKETGNNAHRLRLNILTRNGRLTRTINNTIPDGTRKMYAGEGGLVVNLAGNKVFADLSKATRITKFLSNPILKPIVESIAGDLKAMKLMDINIGDKLFGHGSMATATTASYNALSTAEDSETNLKLSEILCGVNLNITNTKCNIKINFKPEFIKQKFMEINQTVIKGLDKRMANCTVEQANKSTAMRDAFQYFLEHKVSPSLDIVDNANLDIVGSNANSDLSGILHSLLPLPVINLDAPAYLKIDIDYNSASTIKQIYALFGDKTGAGTYDRTSNFSVSKNNARREYAEFIITTGGIKFKSVNNVNQVIGDKAILNKYAETINGNLNKNGKPFKLNNALNSSDDIKGLIDQLPRKAKVSYKDNTTTNGSGLMKEEESFVNIVWDDSRINQDLNGSDESYIYGWIQNYLYAKIKVVVPETANVVKLNNIDIDDSVKIVVDANGKAKIVIDSYTTKKMPETIEVIHKNGVDKNGKQITQTLQYNVHAEKVYQGYEIADETYERIPHPVFGRAGDKLVYNGESVKSMWNGTWKVWNNELNKFDNTEYDGYARWNTQGIVWNLKDTTKLSALASEAPHAILAFSNGRFNEYSMDIPVELAERDFGIDNMYLRNPQEQLNLDFNLLNGDPIEYLNKIIGKDGHGLKLSYSDGDVIFENSEISIKYDALNKWLNSPTSNKFEGWNGYIKLIFKKNIEIPKTKTSSKTSEEITIEKTLKVHVAKMQLLALTTNVKLEINPYEDLEEQINGLLNNKELTALIKTDNNEINKVSILYLANSDKNKIKFDFENACTNYGYQAQIFKLGVQVGSEILGYQNTSLNIEVMDKALNGAKPLDKVNPFDGLDKQINVYFGTSKELVDVIWYDKQKLIDNIGNKMVNIDVIVNRKNINSSFNEHLNQKVTLTIKSISKIRNIKLISIKDGDNEPIKLREIDSYNYKFSHLVDISDNVSLNVSYLDENGEIKTFTKNVPFKLNKETNKYEIEIGIFKFNIIDESK